MSMTIPPNMSSQLQSVIPRLPCMVKAKENGIYLASAPGNLSLDKCEPLRTPCHDCVEGLEEHYLEQSGIGDWGFRSKTE
jgi:hypothetical protein